ncbi:MAG TPA: alanine racemase [Gammaproteobacteria bacterium]|nr:alanine racemase [Gammaproteobacteria bacterium]
MSRPARARIDLAALRHNYLAARRLHGGRALAVLKADAYGHGALACAEALAPIADAFAVAFLAEALALREAGIRKPILVLEGVFSAAELERAAQLGLWLVVHHEEQLRMIENASLHCARLQVWLKIDSGMRRIGVPPERVRDFHARLQATGRVASIALMSHFARADELADPQAREATREQIARFDAATTELPGPRSLANSAGLLAWPEARRDWGRPGLLLYGVDPTGTSPLDLRPVMALTSEVFTERVLAAGEAMGYGGSFVAERPTRVGIVAIGYGDGYPARAPTGTPVAVDGRRTRVLGRVSMDMLAVDLSDLPDAGVGSRVELWGGSVGVAEVAAHAGMLSYELLCNLKRVPVEPIDAARALAATGT